MTVTIIIFVALQISTSVFFTNKQHHENIGEYYGTENVRLLADVIAFERNKRISGP